MKLNLSKFKVGSSVEFGGSTVKYSPENERIQITPSEEKVEELLGREPPKVEEVTSINSWITQPVSPLVSQCESQNSTDEKDVLKQQSLPNKPSAGERILHDEKT